MLPRGQFHKRLHKQLLLASILKVQKKTDNLTTFLALLRSAHIKAACKTLMKLTLGVNYDHHLEVSFSIFITQSHHWTTTTCQQHQQIWGPKGDC